MLGLTVRSSTMVYFVAPLQRTNSACVPSPPFLTSSIKPAYAANRSRKPKPSSKSIFQMLALQSQSTTSYRVLRPPPAIAFRLGKLPTSCNTSTTWLFATGRSTAPISSATVPSVPPQSRYIGKLPREETTSHLPTLFLCSALIMAENSGFCVAYEMANKDGKIANLQAIETHSCCALPLWYVLPHEMAQRTSCSRQFR